MARQRVRERLRAVSYPLPTTPRLGFTVTETVRPEHAIHELAPDASGLAVGQDEELRQLQGSVAHDATGIPDSGPVLLRDPGVRSGAGEVIE